MIRRRVPGLDPLAVFALETSHFATDARNAELIDRLVSFRDGALAPRFVAAPDELRSQADATLEWMSRLPEQALVQRLGSAPLRRVAPTTQRSAADTAQILALGALALLDGGGAADPQLFERMFHLAVGDDPASDALRKPLLPDELPWPGLPPIDLTKIDLGAVRGGALGLYQALAERASEASARDRWLDGPEPVGEVVGFDADHRCGGQTLIVTYGRLEPPAEGDDIVLSIPTRAGAQLTSMRDELAVRWIPAGTLEVILPDTVTSGWVGFFRKPAGVGSASSGRSLESAAEEAQALLGEQFGTTGLVLGHQIVQRARQRAAAFGRPFPVQAVRLDGQRMLHAGAPWITRLAAQTGPVYPHNTLSLEWEVNNASTIELLPEDLPRTESPNELPPIDNPERVGARAIAVPCTTRWSARYALHARNENGCGEAEAFVEISSGYSDYRVGVGKADVTDRRPGLGLQGFAYNQQSSSGADIETPLFARAFAIEENRAGAGRTSIVLVVADIWSCMQSVKAAVADRVKDLYLFGSVLIAGTHTHAGPGGYSDYFLYNYSVEGRDQIVFDTIVDGIVKAIRSAHASLAPGRIYANRGDLAGCGANRSMPAYRRNQEFRDGAPPSEWTDQEMLLLRFVHDADLRRPAREIGALNWFAIHPTNLGMYNVIVSGDNKGWAESLFEERMATEQPGTPFVAAFGNGSAGDVSGNIRTDAAGVPVLDADGYFTFSPPLGGPGKPAQFASDVSRMKETGKAQELRAYELWQDARTELRGPILALYQHVDMSMVQIDGQPGARTWPAAMGVSFGAGSSEDSEAFATIGGRGDTQVDVRTGISEGISQVEIAAGGAELAGSPGIILTLAGTALFTLGLGAAVVGAAAAVGPLAIGVGVAASSIEVVALATALTSIYNELTTPEMRSYVFGILGTLLFPGQLKDMPPRVIKDMPPRVERGTYVWLVPSPSQYPADYVVGHGLKPILIPAGITSLLHVPENPTDGPTTEIPCPLVPHIVPIQLLRIGDGANAVAIVGVPGEITTTAGRRLKQCLRDAWRLPELPVAISGYTNEYSGYITTEEEYNAQHYEGASTLYGPHTLAAYLQLFTKLAKVEVDDAFRNEAFVVPAVHKK